MYKEEWGVLDEEVRGIDKRGMAGIDTLDSHEKTIAIVEVQWWSQAAKREGDGNGKQFLCDTWNHIEMIVHFLLQVSLLVAGTVLRLERDAKLMIR